MRGCVPMLMRWHAVRVQLDFSGNTRKLSSRFGCIAVDANGVKLRRKLLSFTTVRVDSRLRRTLVYPSGSVCTDSYESRGDSPSFAFERAAVARPHLGGAKHLRMESVPNTVHMVSDGTRSWVEPRFGFQSGDAA